MCQRLYDEIVSSRIVAVVDTDDDDGDIAAVRVQGYNISHCPALRIKGVISTSFNWGQD